MKDMTFIDIKYPIKSQHGLWIKKTKAYHCDITEHLEISYNPKKFQWGKIQSDTSGFRLALWINSKKQNKTKQKTVLSK